jgi:hypothetical protein
MAVLVVAVGLLGVVIGRSSAGPTSPLAVVQQAEIDAGMERVVPPIDFHETPFQQVIEFLRDRTHANLVVNWPALQAAGVDRELPVTLSLAKTSLSRVLDVLCTIAGEQDSVKLAVRVENGVIVLSTDQDLSVTTVVRLYDVRDLLEADVAQRKKWRRFPSTQAWLSKQGLFGAPGGAVATYEDLYQASLENLTRIIVENVEPDMWRDAGGIAGSVREFNGRLLITGTPRMQREVAELLETLRKG